MNPSDITLLIGAMVGGLLTIGGMWMGYWIAMKGTNRWN